MLTTEYIEIIINDWPKEWKIEVSPTIGEKNTQQTDASILGQTHPGQPQNEPLLKHPQKDA